MKRKAVCGILKLSVNENIIEAIMKIQFYDNVEDNLLKFAVIISKSKGKWVFCKHKDRNTYEIPGGHREDGEKICDTAIRELKEETGAIDFEIRPLCVYSVTGRNNIISNDKETFGMLYYANIFSFEKELHSEIEKVFFFDELPEEWTYPDIQPGIIEYVTKNFNIGDNEK